MIAALLTTAWAAEIEFGSFGRVQASADAEGGQGESAQVVTYGSRLEKDPYVEVDVVFRELLASGPQFRVVVTPALTGDLFHYAGEWDAQLALRNLFTEFEAAGVPVSVWAGSRMYRGDDVHLLDFWPLDDVNTVGGGVAFAPTPWSAAAHVGLSRVSSGAYQLQTEALPAAGGVGVEQVLFLDRQRVVGSLKGRRTFGTDTVLRIQTYGELHALPAGQRLQDERFVQELPSDSGSLIGAQLSAWGWGEGAFAHLWVKRATGLAAFGDLSVPGGLAVDYRSREAREHLVAAALNHPFGPLSVQLGSYLRRFADADANDVDIDDRWEANVALRPTWFATDLLSVGVEGSQQWLRPDGLNPRTGDHDVPMITKLAVLPAIQPEPSSFARPQVRLQYVYSYLNNDARSWYASADPRHDSNHQHFVGVGAEWWLNSESYDR